jgi:hypothetical protein
MPSAVETGPSKLENPMNYALRYSRGYAVSTDIRSRAIEAFWAMHVEAMN